jgi:hypothetical protein
LKTCTFRLVHEEKNQKYENTNTCKNYGLNSNACK